MEVVDKYLVRDWFQLGRSKEKLIKQTNTVLFGNNQKITQLIGSAAAILFTLVFMILIYSSSNYSNLDDLTLYMEEYSKDKGEGMMFDQVNFGLKIMPGYNTERNALYMIQTGDVIYSINKNSIKKQQLLMPKV